MFLVDGNVVEHVENSLIFHYIFCHIYCLHHCYFSLYKHCISWIGLIGRKYIIYVKASMSFNVQQYLQQFRLSRPSVSPSVIRHQKTIENNGKCDKSHLLTMKNYTCIRKEYWTVNKTRRSACMIDYLTFYPDEHWGPVLWIRIFVRPYLYRDVCELLILTRAGVNLGFKTYF